MVNMFYTFQYNMGHFGGAIAAYDSTLVFLGRNIFQYSNAVVGGGVFAMGSYLAFSGFTAFIGNVAQFGGGGVSAIENCISYNESLQRELLQPYDSHIFLYVRNTAKFGGGLLLVNSTMKLGEGTLEFTAYSAHGIYSNFSTGTLEGKALFKDNSAAHGLEPRGGAAFVSFSMWTTTAVTFAGNTAEHYGGTVYTDSSHMNFRGIAWNVSEETDIPFMDACAHTCLMNNSAQVYGGGGLYAWSTEVIFEGHTRFIGNSAHDGGGFSAQYSSVIISGETTFVGNHGSISGGGLYLLSGFLNVIGNGTFINNTANYSGGAGHCIHNSYLLLEGEYTLLENEANFGGAFSVNEGQATVSGKNCFVQNRAVYGGAIFAKESKSIVLVGENAIISNTARSIGYGGYGEGIHAVRTKIVISGVLNFTNNSALYGGGLSVTEYDSDHFIFVSQANILFFSNFAHNRGGAVLIEGASIDFCVFDFNEVIDGGSCFFQFLDTKHTLFAQQIERTGMTRIKELHNYMYVRNCTLSRITLEDNLAKQGGDDIYGGALHVCRVLIPQGRWIPCGEKSPIEILVYIWT